MDSNMLLCAAEASYTQHTCRMRCKLSDLRPAAGCFAQGRFPVVHLLLDSRCGCGGNCAGRPRAVRSCLAAAISPASLPLAPPPVRRACTCEWDAREARCRAWPRPPALSSRAVRAASTHSVVWRLRQRPHDGACTSGQQVDARESGCRGWEEAGGFSTGGRNLVCATAECLTAPPSHPSLPARTCSVDHPHLLESHGQHDVRHFLVVLLSDRDASDHQPVRKAGRGPSGTRAIDCRGCQCQARPPGPHVPAPAHLPPPL